MTDAHQPPELEERQAALEYLDRVSLFGSRPREFFAELAPG